MTRPVARSPPAFVMAADSEEDTVPQHLRTLAGMAFTLGTAPLAAQVTTTPDLNLEGARRVLAAALTHAREHQAPGAAIAVVDRGGYVLALERLDGTFPAGADISIGKARTAVRFQRPTRVFEEIIRNGRTPMIALNELVGFTPLMGGVPIEVNGTIVGAVGVSGAASAQQDEEIAVAASKALGTAPMAGEAGMTPVAYFEKRAVEAAFAKGDVLVDGSNGRNYMVHASRRETPGQVEVHQQDTDIIHVLSGSATFVTGGTLTDGKMTGAGEIRGATVTGGETRTIKPGDVLVVPKGTPHWFKEVKGPLTYYVVKVR
ncbi:MAG TPA: heme-binding protein [Gemmatimonadales bacterium]